MTTWWKPKAMTRDVTNFELWLLFASGFALGRWLDRWWFWMVVVVLLGSLLARYWWRGYRGLDQWPNPHGRYYNRWLSLKDVGDYYDWLARERGNREPWSEWAKREKELES
jgi:hypothetical protein